MHRSNFTWLFKRMIEPLISYQLFVYLDCSHLWWNEPSDPISALSVNTHFQMCNAKSTTDGNLNKESRKKQPMTHSSFQNINEERWRKSITCQSRRHKVWWGGWKHERESRAANEGERNTKRRVWVCESSCEKRERPGVKTGETVLEKRKRGRIPLETEHHYDPYSLWGALGRV